MLFLSGNHYIYILAPRTFSKITLALLKKVKNIYAALFKSLCVCNNIYSKEIHPGAPPFSSEWIQIGSWLDMVPVQHY